MIIMEKLMRHGQTAALFCAFCAFCNLVWCNFSMLLLPSGGLLDDLQHGAIGGTHYLQLVRVFLKIKNFWKRSLEGLPTQFFFWNRASVRNLALKAILKGGHTCTCLHTTGDLAPLPPFLVDQVWNELLTPPPPEDGGCLREPETGSD